MPDETISLPSDRPNYGDFSLPDWALKCGYCGEPSPPYGHYVLSTRGVFCKKRRGDEDEIRIQLAKILRDKEPGVKHSLATADAIMERFELRKK